jgi:hypothetical protein
MITIYIRLLDEGTEAFRPTTAKLLSSGNFEVLPTQDYNPKDEKWEFAPGSIVYCEERKLDGENVLIAVRAVTDGNQ